MLRTKLRLLARGVRVSEGAREHLAAANGGVLTVWDYPTTSGLTIVLPGDTYANASVVDRGDAPELVVRGGETVLLDGTAESSVLVLPLPRAAVDDDRRVDGVMIHADRVRVSPIDGCAFACAFCDSYLSEYRRRPVDDLVRGIRLAATDPALPARHALISGGTPRAEDREWLWEAYETIIERAGMPVDVMLAPTDHAVLDRLAAAGAAGVAINLEIFDAELSERYCASKHGIGLAQYAEFIEHAVSLFGRDGAVRSLLLMGIEPVLSTLAGVQFIAALGADPVLSPLKPAPGTAFADAEPPDEEEMLYAWVRGTEICESYGVRLGPRCVPCQHNTVTMPAR